MTPSTVHAGYLLFGLGLTVGAWFVLLWLKSRHAEARERRLARKAVDLADDLDHMAELHDRDLDDQIFAVVERDLAIHNHAAPFHDRLTPVTHLPHQRRAGEGS